MSPVVQMVDYNFQNKLVVMAVDDGFVVVDVLKLAVRFCLNTFEILSELSGKTFESEFNVKLAELSEKGSINYEHDDSVYLEANAFEDDNQNQSTDNPVMTNKDKKALSKLKQHKFFRNVSMKDGPDNKDGSGTGCFS